jgi:hypothetical protein
MTRTGRAPAVYEPWISDVHRAAPERCRRPTYRPAWPGRVAPRATEAATTVRRAPPSARPISPARTSRRARCQRPAHSLLDRRLRARPLTLSITPAGDRYAAAAGSKHADIDTDSGATSLVIFKI